MEDETHRILCRFKAETGEILDNLLDLPINITVDKLQHICNAFLEQEPSTPYAFFVGDKEIKTSLQNALELDKLSTEQVIDILYQEQATFRVRAVTRCTSSLPGHTEAVISVNFSPDGQYLASGSGDTTVRFWDIHTQTPHHTCQGHKNWVLCIAWAPDASILASGCKNGQVLLWSPITGQQIRRPLCGHQQYISGLSWEPYARNADCRRLASASKDSDIRVWDTLLGTTIFVLSGHTKCVTSIRWGGTGLIYSGSQDRTIKMWRAEDGVLCRTLEGHAHWVNTLALNTDYALRTGPFNPVPVKDTDGKTLQEIALLKYEAVHSTSGGEILVSGSDDFTLFLWTPEKDKKPVARMTGHQQLINDVKFSPDARIIASASFDKSIKLWCGRTGKYITSLRGHVQAVYQISWSADSRLLVSGSADSTLKVWSIKTGKLELDLPGHADEVFAVDWSPDGLRVVSGGKDKLLKLWQH